MRIGKFTGHFYEEDYDFSKCPECCHYLGDVSVEEALKVKDTLILKNRMDCLTCMGCPAAKETNNVGLIGFFPDKVYGKLVNK